MSARRVRQQRAECDQVPVAAGAVQREAERQQLLAGEACLHARARRHDGSLASAPARATRIGERNVRAEGLRVRHYPSTKDRRAAAVSHPLPSAASTEGGTCAAGRGVCGGAEPAPGHGGASLRPLSQAAVARDEAGLGLGGGACAWDRASLIGHCLKSQPRVGGS